MIILLSVGILLLLIIEGALFVRLILKSEASTSLALSLGLPVSSLLNVLLTAAYTLVGIALSPLSLLSGHLLFTIVFFFLQGRFPRQPRPSKAAPGIWDSFEIGSRLTCLRSTIIPSTCVVLLGMNLIYSFSHAVLLPTFQYDSATNWTHRSQISFYDGQIAFDSDEKRGMAKPQYPFLFHALQITVNQGQDAWSDRAANLAHYLLSVSSLFALFLLVRRLRGLTTALVSVTAVVSIPMVGLHLAQGYADITLLLELLLALACIAMWMRSTPESDRWLLLSGLFVASAVWTKSEGLIAGFLPWFVIIGPQVMRQKDRKSYLRNLRIPLLVTVLLSLTWPLFAWLKGLSLTPHSTDTLLMFSSEGLHEAFLGLFDRGSFGIVWYALAVTLPLILVYARKKHPSVDHKFLPCLLWGGIVFFEILFIYIFTPNVRFLLNAESFYRQMMLPAALLILACGLLLRDSLRNITTP